MQANSIFDSYLEYGYTPGGFIREYVDFGSDNAGDIYSIRRQSEGVYAALHYLAYEKGKGREHHGWEDRIKTVLDLFIRLQNPDGSFPRKFRDDLQVVDTSGGSTSSAILPLAMAYRYFNDRRYLKAAEKAAVYLETSLIAEADYFSSTLDADCEDKEASLYTATAMYYMCLVTKDEDMRRHYADLCLKSAYFALSWYYMWDVPFARGQMLGDVGFKSRGWGNVSVENNHIDVFVFEFADVLDYLAEVYGNPKFSAFTSVIRSSMLQLMPVKRSMFNIARTGYYPEVVQHTVWDYGKNGKGFYNDIFAPGWTVASLWEMLTPGRAEKYFSGEICSKAGKIFTNPVFRMPDPYIVKDGGSYYTCRSQGNGIGISKSDRLTRINRTKQVWKAPADSEGHKVWNRSSVWAPELFHIGDRWYVYYAAGRPDGDSEYELQRTGVLRSRTEDPLGKWEDMGMVYTGDEYYPGIEPTAENTDYAIDMTVFTLNGQMYAVWSGYQDGTNIQNLYIATMSNPWTITSSRVKISTPDRPWELKSRRINEGPAVLVNEKAGKLFIVYSANASWEKDYCLGYLMLDMKKGNPMNPADWKKSDNAVFYRCDDTDRKSGVAGVNGLGHCSFTKSPDGREDWIVYHAMKFADGGWGERYTFMQKVGWKKDGTPDFGKAAGWGEEIQLPSGE